MTTGLVHPRTFWRSTTHITVARLRAAIPAVKTTYELVQRLLLIGKTQCHMSATIIMIDPAADIPASRSVSGRRSAIHRPAMLPSMAVQIAGTVLRTPSGSQVTPDTQRWLP